MTQTINGNTGNGGGVRKWTLVGLLTVSLGSLAAKAGAWAWDEIAAGIKAHITLHETVGAHTVILKRHDDELAKFRDTAVTDETLRRVLKALEKAEKRGGRN